MSINKALKQVMMYEEIGGKKKENPQPTDTTPVKMPGAPRPAGPKPKSTRGVNAPPPKRPLPFPVPSDTTRETQPKPIRPGSQPRPIPANGGAEVTPPQGLPESMKAFWKKRLGNQLNGNELNEKKGVLGRLAKGALGLIGVDETGVMPLDIDPLGIIPDPFVGPGGNTNPSAYPENSPDYQFGAKPRPYQNDDPDYPDAPSPTRDPATGNEYSPRPSWANNNGNASVRPG
jgi:hypothetical protein